LAGSFYVYDKISGISNGFDAMQAAFEKPPGDFENALVAGAGITVLQRARYSHAPSPVAEFLFELDAGGRTPPVLSSARQAALRQIRAGMSLFIRALGACSWMNPEPMQAIEVVENSASAQPHREAPTDLRSQLSVICKKREYALEN